MILRLPCPPHPRQEPSQEDIEEAQASVAFLERAWPRLEVWFKWYNTTQAGSVEHTYRWVLRVGRQEMSAEAGQAAMLTARTIHTAHTTSSARFPCL